MRQSRSNGWVRIAVGVFAGLLLHGVAGWFSSDALAQGTGSTNSTLTTSTSSSTFFHGGPSGCKEEARTATETVTLEDTVGPNTIIIGDRDHGGTAFQVLAGWSNLNINTHTQIDIYCVAAGTAASVPALSWPALLGLAGILAALGAWQLSRR